MNSETLFHQDYKTYTFDPSSRDILVEEYKSAEKVANSQYKLFQQLAGLLLGIATIFIPLRDKIPNNSTEVLPLTLFAFGTSIILLLCFAELQKTITFNARKVVVLREMLGLHYGPLLLVLPTWRIEGASNPTGIKLFPGWITMTSIPLWVVSMLFSIFSFSFIYEINSNAWYLTMSLSFVLFLLFFRSRLFDIHETPFLFVIKCAAFILRINLVRNLQNTIYKVKLAAYELERLRVDLSMLKKVLVVVEDKNFYRHRGVSIKSLVRSIFSNIPFIRVKKSLLKSGGSTITMQLCRTLFIDSRDYGKTYRRKIIEILLAIWWDRQLTKDSIIAMYIASVRYDRRIMGLPRASKHFFGEFIKVFDPVHSLLLVERISNLSLSYRPRRISYLVTKIKDELGVIISQTEIEDLYRNSGIKAADLS